MTETEPPADDLILEENNKDTPQVIAESMPGYRPGDSPKDIADREQEQVDEDNNGE